MDYEKYFSKIVIKETLHLRIYSKAFVPMSDWVTTFILF